MRRTGAATGRPAGAYELLEGIEHGGMGEVYRARRADGQYDQQVAVKLIRNRCVSQSGTLIERFRTERQILARLDHPKIARLFDGGTTEDGFRKAFDYCVPSWRSVNGWPAIVSVTERAAPLFACSSNSTVPLPDPLAP